jgi:hypothetical protein
MLTEMVNRATLERSLSIACSNCYVASLWDGSLSDTYCSNCKTLIHVEHLARSLVHLFCAPAQNNTQGEHLYYVLKFLSEHGWGNGVYIGRHDWVLCGCPLDIEDFCLAIKELSDVPLTALSRILCSKPSREAMIQHKNKIAEAVASRLVSNPPDALGREHLYDILQAFPAQAATPILTNIAQQFPTCEGRRGSPVRQAMDAALDACSKTQA